MAVTAALRAMVVDRAGDRCEYCHARQVAEPFFRYHVEHVIARQHGGATHEHNLCLACQHCNLHEGPNLTGIDADTQAVVRLFHPRQQLWDDHFLQQGVAVVGRTPTGRATARVLAMNAPTRLQVRAG